jgi:hypothetical protein
MRRPPYSIYWLLCLLVPVGLHGQAVQSARSHSNSNLTNPRTRTPSKVDRIVTSWSKFADSRRSDTHFAWTVSGDHENAGIYTKGGGPYVGVEAVHVVFKSGEFDLEFPSGGHGAQTLYAPTTRPPNGSCLEVGTAYTTPAAFVQTVVYVYVYDFCKSPVRTLLVNDEFMHNYVKGLDNGAVAYKIRITPDGNSLAATTTWSAMIYNDVNNEWDTVATSRGVRSDSAGWSIFETWYGKGQCSKTLKLIKAVDIAYYNALSGAWEPIVDDMRPLRNDVSRGGNCFMDGDPSNLASYKVEKLASSHGWQVIGTGH